METDLTYTNRAGISLQNVLDVLVDDVSKDKKDIQYALDTDKSIDVLLKKLEEISLIEKQKEGNKLLYKITKIKDKKPSEEKKEEVSELLPNVNKVIEKKIDVSQQPKARVANKAKPKLSKSPAEIKKINTQTAVISKNHQITTLVEVEEEKKQPETIRGQRTAEVNDSDLAILKKEMESKLGKEVTAVLHKRNDRAIKKRKESAQNIYERQQAKIETTDEVYDKDNPYRFVLNFFVSTLNGEKATPYFRRRDEYVVKSIYNKFKSLCDSVDDYSISTQNLPFYRVITINMDEKAVKMYHIDMNRVVRGVYTIFKLNRFDDMFISFK